MTETKAAARENSEARETILASIRSNLSKSAPFDAAHREHHGHAEKTADASIRPELPREILIDNFKKNLEFVGGHCTVVSNELEASESVRAIIEKTGATRVAISDSELIKRIVADIDVFENAPANLLFGCDLGITSAQWAIAETGTLVLESEAESHRLTSLVPRVHLCILKADQIRQTLGEILELVSTDLSRTITFITGASRTSDIELTLAIGVHGPAELHVIVIADL